MNNLKYGLNVKSTSKKSLAIPNSTKTSFSLGLKKKVANEFNQGSDSDEQDKSIPLSHLEQSNKSTAETSRKRMNAEIVMMQTQRSRLVHDTQKDALEQDPSVFDYDGVYDHLKRAELEKKKARDGVQDGQARKKVSLMIYSSFL